MAITPHFNPPATNGADDGKFLQLRGTQVVYSAAATPAELESAAGDRQKVDGTAGRMNIVAGHSSNAIASDVEAATILGGGQDNRENVIGAATTANVNTATSNLPTAAGTVANYSVILGGYDNVANGLMSMIGGAHNYSESATSHATISGGSVNAIESGDYSTIIGGTLNTVNGSNNSVGGRENVVDASDCTVFGKLNTVNSGADGSIAIGTQNDISVQGFALGVDCAVDGTSASAIGRRSRARTYGQFAQAADFFASQGDAQTSVLTLRRETTNGTEAVCGATGSTNSHVLLASQVVGYSLVVVAREDATGDCKMWTIAGAMKRPASGSNTHVGGSAPTPTVVAGDAGASAWSCRIDISTNILVLRVTGEASRTIRWCARMELTEVGTF